MPQIFHYSANYWARASIVGIVCLVGFVAWAGYTIDRGSYETRQLQSREQPVPFSHAHHVGALGIDCRYCHTSVEESSFANIPPIKTCINCHSQIWNTSPTLEPVRASFRTGESINWTRVHDLPDFVYFNHSIHVKRGRLRELPRAGGQNAADVESELARNEWCIDCHRNTQRVLRPRDSDHHHGLRTRRDQEEIGRRLQAEYHTPDVRILTSCSTCHR